MRQLAAEITREKLFERLHQELPYHSTVETEVWKELRGGGHPYRADHLRGARKPAQDCARQGRADNQGDRRSARKEITEIVEKPRCTFFLFVKVREGWGEDPERYRAMGLEFPKE